MPDLSLFFLTHVCSALLPPIDPEDQDFYDVLGVSGGKSASNEAIRKAYKKKSLQLHPDKVAQRGADQATRDEAAAQYEKVQEAYHVLVNDEKRSKYHALQCAPERYRFVVQRNGLSNFPAVHQNLAAASFSDKTRLVLFVGVVLAFFWIQPILIATKINHALADDGDDLEDSKWTAILAPYWILHSLYILLQCLLAAMVPAGNVKISLCAGVVEHLLWLTTVAVLANAWDDGPSRRTEPFRKLLTPAYLAMLVRWFQACVFLNQIRTDIGRMVSVHHLETVILEGRSMESIEDEAERGRILSQYIIITVPDDFDPIVDENDTQADQEMETEQQKIESSPEYDAAIMMYNSAFSNLTNSVIFGTPFIILLVRKLDGKMDESWWVVFIPFWIYVGFRLLSNCFRCIFMPVIIDDADDLIIPMAMAEGGEGGNDDDSKKKNENDEEQADAAPIDVTQNASKAEEESSKEDEETGEHRKGIPRNVREDSVGFDTVVGDVSSGRKTTTGSETKDGASNSAAATEKKTKKSKPDNGNDDGEEVKDDDDDDIGIDADTFRAFQSAYAKAEEDAVQKQAAAGANCCIATAQLTILCLIVAKLEAATESTGSNDVGFNTFWILFPFLLVFSLIYCNCVCFIYGVSSEEGMYDEHAAPTDQAATDDVEAPTVITPPPQAFVPPPPPTTDAESDKKEKTDASSQNEEAKETAKPVAAPAVDVDMEDLD